MLKISGIEIKEQKMRQRENNSLKEMDLGDAVLKPKVIP